MIKNLGVDVIEVDRIKSAVDKWGGVFLQRIFTASEIEYSKKHRFSCEHLAARFAAKEAVFKAFGDGNTRFIKWTDIEILNDNNGRPHVFLHGNAKSAIGDGEVMVSMAHTKRYAVANAAIVKK